MKMLASKISRIYGQITAQEKAGFNQHSKYNYFSEAQLQSYIRPLFAKEGIAIFHSTDKITITHIPPEQVRQNEWSKAKIHSTVETSHTIIDSESGETFVCRSVGEGIDTGDKATYKAITGAVKYFLMKLLGISDHQDPENDGGIQEEHKAPVVVAEPKPEPKQEVAQAKDFYRKSLIMLAEKEGIPESFILDGCRQAKWIPDTVACINEMQEDRAKALLGHMPRIKAKFAETNK